jgi:hypothetical protein
MPFEPLPWQLTVGKLRKVLENVPDDTVVALVVPAGGIGHPELQLIMNLQVTYTGGPVVGFSPYRAPDEK